MKLVAALLLLGTSCACAGVAAKWDEGFHTAVDDSLILTEGPELIWDSELHAYSQEVDILSGVVKTYEKWISVLDNRTRIDMDGGISKTYYFTKERFFDWIKETYRFEPGVDENENPTEKCVLKKRSSDFPSDHWSRFWLDPDQYKYIGEKKLGALDVHHYEEYNEDSETKNKVTLYVTQKSIDDVILSQPVQLITESWDVGTGALSVKKIETFLSYQNHIEEGVLEPDTTNCEEEYSLEETLASLDPLVPGHELIAFDLYKKHHKKTYEHKDEHKMRAEIFHKNWKLIQKHNQENHKFKLQLNQFADRLPNELPLQSLRRLSEPIIGTHPFPLSEQEAEDYVSTLPKEFDMRAEGYISPVVNQGACGSCWAFAITASMEGTLSRANGGNAVDLSEQSLVDCAWNFGAAGCQGAVMDDLFKFVLKYGFPTVMEYGPYLEMDGVCSIHNMTNLYGIRGYTAVTPKSANALKTALFKSGPVVVAILANYKFMFYKHGIFYDTECDEESNKNISNHAVTVVGYGYEDGDLFWIVKNSYGSDWGEDGYIRMAARNNNCNLLNEPIYPIV